MRVKCNTTECENNIDGYCHGDEVIITFDVANSINAKVECCYEVD